MAYEIDPFTINWYDINASLDVTINFSPSSPVPEPATLFLIGIGLAGMAGVRKKLKK